MRRRLVPAPASALASAIPDPTPTLVPTTPGNKKGIHIAYDGPPRGPPPGRNKPTPPKSRGSSIAPAPAPNEGPASALHRAILMHVGFPKILPRRHRPLHANQTHTVIAEDF